MAATGLGDADFAGVAFGLAGVGVAAARDAIIDELGDVAQAMLSVDQSYQIFFPLGVVVHTETTTSGASDSEFIDAVSYTDCDRVVEGSGQDAEDDVDS